MHAYSEAGMAKQGTLFSFGVSVSGVTRSNVPRAKRRCMAGEEREDDDSESDTELQLRQFDADAGSNRWTTSDRQRTTVEVGASPELCGDLGKITIAQARKLSDKDKR